ncbi:DNA polymerase III subunit alpha [Pseudoramibacter porci]|uniref:DNA polymerase III subunit alpha n=1 Tax=Pseudoramibacter porci TaxID=2606631 RepID=A0A7X2T9Q4_9FIRM|nr:DNA polymerase III subunit alpha [Pseudoramibacter porci]MSS19627.1 DNA polymerase III subunit alpha [Pseudoramibacter porci]
MKSPFVHLHLHTEYSLLDGFGRVNDYVQSAKKMGMDAIALTDHGVLFGAIEFYKACQSAGIKPIIGCEVYIAPRGLAQKSGRIDSQASHLILLAESNTGYRNLSKIVSKGYIDGFYYKPRVDHQVLKQYHEGIICLSACISGEIPKAILGGQEDKALALVREYQSIFGEDHFYLEVQDHGLIEEAKVRDALYRFSKQYNVPLAATNDCHYVNQSDYKAHDVLLCIGTGATVDEENRMRYPNDQFYFKSPDEMAALFPDHPEALENTVKIAERCDVTFDMENAHLPQFELPEGFESAGAYLRHLCETGLAKRYDPVTPEIQERMAYELATIHEMGFDNYFLVVWDFIHYAKTHGIPVGPGRGSAAGSLVAYALDITTLDPLKYNLIFERFLNPERVTMPDIDCDFCYERRQEVIDYVIRKYGKDRVAQIITFGTMAARGAVRDVGRVLGMPYSDVDKVAKEIPMRPGQNVTIEEALKENPDLRKMADEDVNVRELLQMSEQIEGLARHASTHAAGVVIADAPLTEYVPLYRNGDAITTQYTMNLLEDLGLIKMDFLGLRTLTVIHDALNNIKQTRGLDIDINQIDMEDPKVYQLIASGDDLGIFQLESRGMMSFMRELNPQHFEDIVAGISLYRPGPMDQIPRYIANKKDPAHITYLTPELKPILDVTYGCMVYQEQVMQIFRDLAGFSMGRSDLVRRAMSKKKSDVMDAEGEVFIHGEKDADGNVTVPGAVAKGIPENVARQIYEEMKDFAKYAFNKSHAAAYAVVAYQTAWLKCYYPAEFMAALMSSVMDNEKKIAQYIDNCKKHRIIIKAPDVNESQYKFSVGFDDQKKAYIRIGFGAIKGLGQHPADEIVKAREKIGAFKTMTDFFERVDLRLVTKKVVLNLILAGGFDFLGYERSQMVMGFPNMINRVADEKRTRLSGQVSLLDMGELDDYKGDRFPSTEPFTKEEKLVHEKEVLGLYVSGHPLEHYTGVLASETNLNASMMDSYEDLVESGIKDGGKVCVGGMVDGVKIQLTKNNDQMAFLSLEDLFGHIEIVVFPRTFNQFRSRLHDGEAVLVRGRINYNEEMNVSIIADQIEKLDQVRRGQQPKNDLNFTIHEEKTRYNKKSAPRGKLVLAFHDYSEKGKLNRIKPLLKASPGDTPVLIQFEREQKKFGASRSLWVTADSDLIKQLKGILGEDKVSIR